MPQPSTLIRKRDDFIGSVSVYLKISYLPMMLVVNLNNYYTKSFDEGRFKLGRESETLVFLNIP